MLRQCLPWPGGQVVRAEEQAKGNDAADVPGVADWRPVAHGQFFALR
jgi:hypothetical protein